jgi:hypothetical protein
MSAAAVTAEVVAVLGVLGVGSILGQYVGSAKDRREARAGVLSALADTESSRWLGPDSKTTLGEFQTSMRKLQTAPSSPACHETPCGSMPCWRKLHAG